MQSIFPYLLSFDQMVPFIMRIVGGCYFFMFGYRGLTSDWQNKVNFFKNNHFLSHKFFALSFSIVELVCGAMLLMGFLTQLVALVLLIISITAAVIRRDRNTTLQRNTDTYLLLGVLMICLIISGAGYYGMDLPI